MASFIGYAPAAHPKLAAIVVLDEPTSTYGGTAAAPVFADVMQFALSHNDVAPDDSSNSAVQRGARVRGRDGNDVRRSRGAAAPRTPTAAVASARAAPRRRPRPRRVRRTPTTWRGHGPTGTPCDRGPGPGDDGTTGANRQKRSATG